MARCVPSGVESMNPGLRSLVQSCELDSWTGYCESRSATASTRKSSISRCVLAPFGARSSTYQYNWRFPFALCCCASWRASSTVNSQALSLDRSQHASHWAGQVSGKYQPRVSFPLPPAGVGFSFVLPRRY